MAGAAKQVTQGRRPPAPADTAEERSRSRSPGRDMIAGEVPLPAMLLLLKALLPLVLLGALAGRPRSRLIEALGRSARSRGRPTALDPERCSRRSRPPPAPLPPGAPTVAPGRERGSLPALLPAAHGPPRPLAGADP
jgi:hypothetical protein